MHWKLLKLMAPESTDGGGGGAPTGTAPQAQGASGSVTLEQIRSLLADHAAEVKNGVFADLRRSGYFGGKGSKGDAEVEKPKPQAAPGDDVQRLIARERAFSRATATVKLSDGALARMEKAFQAESPDDVADWVKGYLEDFGFSAAGSSPPQNGTSPNQPTATAPAAQSAAPTQPTTPPAPPAPAPVPLGDLERAAVHPNRLTADQVARLGPKGVHDYVNSYFRKSG